MTKWVGKAVDTYPPPDALVSFDDAVGVLKQTMEIEQNFLWICWSNPSGGRSPFEPYDLGFGFLLLHVGLVDIQRGLIRRASIVSREAILEELCLQKHREQIRADS